MQNPNIRMMQESTTPSVCKCAKESDVALHSSVACAQQQRCDQSPHHLVLHHILHPRREMDSKSAFLPRLINPGRYRS